MFSVKIDADKDFLQSEKYSVLNVMSDGHALHVFINGQLSGMSFQFSAEVHSGILG